MIEEGQVVLFPFPQTDQKPGKLRPALALCKCPTQYEDWLICMISSQIAQLVPDIDEIIAEHDADFSTSGLKQTSIMRLTRLAVVNQAIFLGSVADIPHFQLAHWGLRTKGWGSQQFSLLELSLTNPK